MAEVGDSPGEDFAPHSSHAIEALQKLSDSGDLGKPICGALILNGGRMLITHEAKIDGESIYLSILCSRVPAGVQTLIKKIVTCIAKTLMGNNYREHDVE